MRSVEVHFENTVNDYPERLFGILVEPAMQIIDGFRHRIIRSALNTQVSILKFSSLKIRVLKISIPKITSFETAFFKIKVT